MDKMKWLFIALPIFIIIFLINSSQQSKLRSNSDQIFEICLLYTSDAADE